jgi:hypothetical protein
LGSVIALALLSLAKILYEGSVVNIV